MRWYLIRHAQTIWNSEGRIQGHTDSPLSPLGVRQAACLGTHFASFPIRAIVASQFVRSQDTATAIAQANGHKLLPIIEPDIGEISLGNWEGLTADEVDARFDGAYRRWRLTPSEVEVPGAEPLEVFRERVQQVRKKLTKNFTEGETAIVSHGGVIAALLADILHADYDILLQRIHIDTAGITAIEFLRERSPQVLWINSISHLELAALPTQNGPFSASP